MAGKRKAGPPPRPSLLQRFRQGLAGLAARFVTHLLVPILLPLFLVALGLLGLYLLQWTLRDQGGPVPAPFRAIECAAPPGLTRAEFLDSVQAYANLPDQLDLVDPALPERLRSAFASNPWVERVERITPLPHALRVDLVFRVPVMQAQPSPDGKPRAVDIRGILLPERAQRDDLPRFVGRIEVPPTRPGSVWADPRLRDAALVAGWLAPRQSRLRLEKLDVDERGVLIITAWGRKIVWGSPPGAERPGERSAEQKLELLLKPALDPSLTEQDLRR